jgi:laminin B (domain IV)
LLQGPWSRAGIATALAAGAIAVSAAAAPLVASTFDTDADGWVFHGTSSDVPVDYFGTGGNPGGYISHTDPNTGLASGQKFVTTATFGGDISSAYGGTLTFDLRSNAPGDRNADPVNVDLGSGNPCCTARAYPSNTDQAPGVNWTTYSVRLVYTDWCAPVPPYPCMTSTSEFKDFLASGHILRIAFDYYDGANEKTDLDNVKVNPPERTAGALTLAYKGSKHKFSGKLTSGNEACKGDRRVKVFKKKKGPDSTVGSDNTSASGSYSISKKAIPGRYYAKTGSALRPEDGLLCDPVKSKSIRVT